jgi:hypothetical protein
MILHPASNHFDPDNIHAPFLSMADYVTPSTAVSDLSNTPAVLT